MHKGTPRSFAFLAAVALLTTVAGTAAASSVTVNVNTSTHEATWISHSEMYVNFTYPSQGAISTALNGTSGSLSVTVSAQSSQSVSVTSDMNGSVSTLYQHAYLRNASLDYNVTWTANATQLSIVLNSTLSMDVYGIGNGTSNSVNMSWKDFNYTGSVNVTTSSSGTVDVNSPASSLIYSRVFDMFASSRQHLSLYHAFDYSFLSKRLSDWNRSYESSSDRTVYSYDAGVTVNRTFNMTVNYLGIQRNYTLSIYLDPAAQISTAGNTYAVGNTLYVSPSRGLGTGFFAAVAAVIAVAAIGSVAFVLHRKRK